MKLSCILFLGFCLLFTSVPVSHQYGQIFADTVLPVKNDFVHFPDTTSNHITTEVFDIGGLTLADPGGFNVKIDSRIDIASNDSLTFVGDLGFGLGGSETQLLNFTVAHDFQMQSEDFFAMFSQINFNMLTQDDYDASIEFDSARHLNVFANDIIDIDGSNLLALQSVHGNLDAFAPNVFGAGSRVPITSDESVSFFSRTGFIDWTAEEGIFFTGDLIDLTSEQNTEMVADQDLSVHAEDLVQITSGNHILSALGDLNFSSTRNVDFTSPSGFFVSAGTSINFKAGEEFYLKSTEEQISQVTAVANDRVRIAAADSGFFGSRDITWEIYQSQSIIANTMTMDSTATTTIGNEETSNVNFNAVANNIMFMLNNPAGEGDELDFNSRFVSFDVANDLSVSAGSQFRSSTGISEIDVNSNTNVNARDIYFESVDEAGSFIATAPVSQTFTSSDDIRIDSHSTTYTASTITSNSNDVDLEFNVKMTVTGTDVSITSDDSTIKGGNVVMNAFDVSFFPTTTGSPVMTSSSYSDMRMHIGDQFNVESSQQDVDFYTGNDFTLSIGDDFNALATDLIEIDVDDDAYFYAALGDFEVDSGNDIEFVNNVDTDDFQSFAFVEDIAFSVPAGTGAYDLDADGDILFDAAHDILISSLDDAFITSNAVTITTLSDRPSSGISFDAGVNTIFSDSGDDTTFSGDDVRFVANDYSFTTQRILNTASEHYVAFATNSIQMTVDTLFSVKSNGDANFLAGDDLELTTTGGDLTFAAMDSVNMTNSQNFVQSSGKDTSVTSGDFRFVASEVLQIETFNLYVTAATKVGGALVNLLSFEDIIYDNEEFTTISAMDVLFKSSGDQDITTDGDISITSPIINISGHSMDTTLTGNFEINAGDISFFTDEFEAYFASSTDDLKLLAYDSVYITSDGDLTFNHPGGAFTATASDTITVVSDDSIAYSTQAKILFQNKNAAIDESIQISSGGRTAFFANTGSVTLQSSDTIDIEAGEIIMDAWKNMAGGPSGAIFTANKGDIQMISNHGTIHYDSDENVLLNATNPDTSASHFFTSTNGVRWATQTGGMHFNVEGSIGENSFEFASMGNNGDIVFDSQLGGINIFVEDDIDYSAARNITMEAAFGAEFTPEIFMSFTAPNGQLDVNAQRGITLLAGTDNLDNSDILFNQPLGTFEMFAGDQITFHSTGEVDGDSITVSGQSDIRFQTGNTGDIRFYGDGNLTFTATGTFTSTSTNNHHFMSDAGSISIDAVTGADFYTEGGPIRFVAESTDPNGAITLTAQTGDVEFNSGNSTIFSTKQFAKFVSQDGISVTSNDGSIDILAASQDSFIRMISQGGMSITSTGNDLTPDEGIVLDSANNIEFGSVDTKTISINSVDRVTTGTYSRPVITFNAAGSASQMGFTISSDGGIYTQTDAELVSDITQDFLIDSAVSIMSTSYGPTSITNIGSEGITLDSNAGILRLSGDDQMKLTSNTQIVATSAGSVQFDTSGQGVVDQIRFTAPQVEILSGNHQLMISDFDADVTNTFTLTTSGEGIFDATLDQQSSISFQAGTAFDITSAGELYISSIKQNGPILFETQKSTSSITLTTDTQSDIEFKAEGEFGIFGETYSLSAPNIVFSAVNTDSNDDRSLGDIEILAESDINGSAVEDLFVSAQENLLIETTGSFDDVGAPMQFTATGEIAVTSSKDTTIRNVPKQGGTLNFNALSDVILENTNTDGWITFDSDADYIQTTTRNNEFYSDKYFAEVGGDYSVTTAGRDPNDDFGIRMDVEQNDATFRALFGSIKFTSATTGTVLSQGNINMNTDNNGLFEGTKTTLTASNGRVILTAKTAGVEYSAQDGIDFTVGTNLGMTANGVDDNGDFGIAFEANSSGPFEIDIGKDISINADGLFVNGNNVNFDAVTGDINIVSADGDISAHADTLVTFYSESITSTSNEHQALVAGTINVDAEAKIDFTGENDIVLQTTGPDAAIEMYSSGETSFRTNSGFNLNTERRKGADINLIASLGRIEFNPGAANADGFPLDFLADFGDLTFTAMGDDADIYGTSAAFTFVASNSVNYIAGFDMNVIDGAANNFNAQVTASFQANDNIAFTVVDGLLIHVHVDDSSGEGGTFYASAAVDVEVTGDTIDVRSVQRGGTISLYAADNIDINAPTVSISSGAVMKIPTNYNERESSSAAGINCINGNFFWFDRVSNDNVFTENDNSIGYLCVCGIGCAPFYEPPCDPADDVYCTASFTL